MTDCELTNLRTENKLLEAIRRLAEQDATLSVCDGRVIVTMDATLTDKEREAIKSAADFCESTCAQLPSSDQLFALRALLERTK
jgi:hypothetical protein